MTIGPDFWRYGSLSRSRRADLLIMVDQARAAGCSPDRNLATNGGMRGWILEMRAAERGRRDARRGGSVRPAMLCEIPAVEVNAWLRSLPTDPQVVA